MYDELFNSYLCYSKDKSTYSHEYIIIHLTLFNTPYERKYQQNINKEAGLHSQASAANY